MSEASDHVRYDLNPEEGGPESDNYCPMAITLEQLKAMEHALTGEMIFGMISAEDVNLENYGALGLVIDAYDSQGWLLVGYPWNAEGIPVWLAADGGWHFQPDETGYYPWRENEEG